MKDGKAVVVNEIPAEMWKRMGDKALIEILEFCQKMYEEGKWPDDFTKVVMISLPKKSNRMQRLQNNKLNLSCIKNYAASTD